MVTPSRPGHLNTRSSSSRKQGKELYIWDVEMVKDQVGNYVYHVGRLWTVRKTRARGEWVGGNWQVRETIEERLRNEEAFTLCERVLVVLCIYSRQDCER